MYINENEPGYKYFAFNSRWITIAIDKNDNDQFKSKNIEVEFNILPSLSFQYEHEYWEGGIGNSYNNNRYIKIVFKWLIFSISYFKRIK